MKPDDRHAARTPRTQPFYDPLLDHLELSVHYVVIENGEDIAFEKVHWQWRGRCPRNGTAATLAKAETQAILALDDWSRA